jgi:hypothetical protein
MKKITFFLLLALFVFSLVACTLKNFEVVNITYDKAEDHAYLTWNNIKFDEFHTIFAQAGDNLNVRVGKQIAFLRSENTKLCEIVGFSPDEWLIAHFQDEMSNEYTIYKAITVQNIPPEFVYE